MNFPRVVRIGDGSSDRCAVEEDACRGASFDKLPVFPAKAGTHVGWAIHQPAAVDANLRWQCGVSLDLRNSLIPAHAGNWCHESRPSLPEVPATRSSRAQRCAGMSGFSLRSTAARDLSPSPLNGNEVSRFALRTHQFAIGGCDQLLNRLTFAELGDATREGHLMAAVA